MNEASFTITREFNAPVSAVWRAWSEPEIVSIWYGPGVQTTMHHFDFKEGGYWHEEMSMGENSMFGRSQFAEIIPHEKIVLHQSSADDSGNVIDNPMMPNWPRVMEAVVSFEEKDGKTQMVFTWSPHQASEEQMNMFAQMKDRMGNGWDAGFNIMEAEIEKL